MFEQNFTTFKANTITQLSADIDALFAQLNIPSPLKDACQYAMTVGGKRVRPLLVASSYDALAGQQQSSDMTRRAMLSVELLHAYSLVHDDLPCMDDDDLRRGQPTCHIKFGEATALLAGDMLQTLAFEVLTTDIKGFNPADMPIASQLLTTFAPRARRMVSGQMLDLTGEGKNLNQNELQAIHEDKTGALIEASVLMGGICAGATSEQTQHLQAFAKNLGLAFQVQDDILDVTADTEQLGKPAGSDEKLDKSTYVKLMGVSEAEDYAASLFANSKMQLEKMELENSELANLANWLWARKH